MSQQENIQLKTSFNLKLNLVVAYTFGKQGIGSNGTIPWTIPEDMKHFKELTIPKSIEYPFSIVIMGRKTWESIPENRRPLTERFNVILSNNSEYIERENAKYGKRMIDSKSGILFSTWDDFFSNSNIYLLEKRMMDSVPENMKGYIQRPFSYYIIGGEQIYKKALDMCHDLNLSYSINATEIYLTKEQEQVPQEQDTASKYACDTFFPKIDESLIITSVSPFYKSKSDLLYRFITYEKTKNSDTINIKPKSFYTQENDYLDLMRNILENGSSNDDRTGVGTVSIFGSMLKYDLRDTFPLCTTKRMFFRAIFEELMFYLSGKTDNKILQAKGIHVWDGNTSREFLDKRGLAHYEEGDMGQTYGFNYRHFGGEYKGCGVDYGLQRTSTNSPDNTMEIKPSSRELDGLQPSLGYDQVANVINLIKTEPSSRRIIIDLWDCSTVHKAALPSCLCKYQFNVNVKKKELNLAIYLRSSDYFLANNWNTCCGALFVHLLCNLEGIDLTPGDLTVFIADAHLYKTHLEKVKINLERSPYPFPKLLVNQSSQGVKKNDILDFKFEDIELVGYKSYPNIKAEMAI
uniref:DHFR domain-containing protein n=1 Tax=viral metagenome TaxID=1070528 RepID=A0A6C0F024_9ZZZZ